MNTLEQLLNNIINYDKPFTILNESIVGNNENFPAYNLIKTSESEFILEMGLAGYHKEDISIKSVNDKISITVEPKAEKVEKSEHYFEIHRGLTQKKFEKVFSVDGGYLLKIQDAKFENGILTINLKAELPETLKPVEFKLK